MQLAASGLDPTLDRFTVAGHFCLRQVRAHGRPRAAVLQRHKQLITAAALTGATVTVSGACPRLGREHVRGGRGSATWSPARRGGQAC
jgi:hypothetical protein